MPGRASSARWWTRRQDAPGGQRAPQLHLGALVPDRHSQEERWWLLLLL